MHEQSRIFEGNASMQPYIYIIEQEIYWNAEYSKNHF